MECSSDQCKQRRSELDAEVKMLRRELSARDEDVRQLELETQVCHCQHSSIAVDSGTVLLVTWQCGTETV